MLNHSQLQYSIAQQCHNVFMYYNIPDWLEAYVFDCVYILYKRYLYDEI